MGWCSSIALTMDSNALRQFSHGPVNGQRGFRIWLFRFPFIGFIHYQPPHECYIELSAQTATKC
jgi:hypothetical protein